jgi:spermidine synthase
MPVALCFLLSGFAALLYQTAWLKSLGTVFGTSHIAVASVLAAYMAGLAGGAAIAARLIHTVRRPVLLYGILEGLIAASALLVPVLLSGAQYLLVVLYGGQPEPVSADSPMQSLYYLVATFIILAIPTAAMGATLPLLARYSVREVSQVGSRIGLLYGLNTLGAVAGTLVAAFLLLPRFGLLATLVVGAGVNLLVFLIALLLHRREGAASANALDKPDIIRKRSGSPLHWVMPLMLLSGVVSFTLEVLWTRLLSHVFGGTVYAFAIMLACFLAGIALGGLAAGRLARDRRQAIRFFIASQVLIAGLSFSSYLLLQVWHPESGGLWPRAMYALAIILPSTLFIGATYPLAVRIATSEADFAGEISGRIYAWNTVGAICGALLAGFVLLPLLGFAATLKSAMVLSLMLAAAASWAGFGDRRWLAAGAAAVLLAALFLHPARPDRLIYSHVKGTLENGEEHYYGVGRSATILLREIDGFFNLSSNGLSESAVGRAGMPPFNLSQKWLAGLPTLARPNAQSMLIIGLGGGIALEGVPPHITDLDVIELEPEVVEANRAVAELRGSDPLQDPRLRLVINDARNAIMLTEKRYDAIVSQPSHPWTGGASHLYTAEFLSQAKHHLQPGGVFLQWINSQFLDADLLRTLVATIAGHFAHVQLYQPERQVLLFLASDEPLDLWRGAGGAARALQAYPRHYQRMGMRTVEDIIAMMTLDDAGLRKFSAGAPLNTDNHNRLAFFSRAQADGLTADDMLDLFERHDPLTDSQSDFHRFMADDADVAHLAEQLLQGNFIQRSFRFGRALSSPALRAVVDGLGFDHSGDIARARTAFSTALQTDPALRPAQLGMLRTYLGDFARADVPAPVGALANRLSGPDRRVLEGWVFGAAGAFDRLQGLDTELAAVAPTSLFYPISVKLRVDWRVVEARRSNDPSLAADALEVLDDLLASYWNLDLYILRSGCAFLAGNAAAFVESAAAAGRQVRGRLDKEGAAAATILSRVEAGHLEDRLKLLRQQLEAPLTNPMRERASAVAQELTELIQRLR